MLESSPVVQHAPASKPGSAGALDQGKALRLLLILCVGQVLLWGLSSGLVYSAPEIDSAEQFVWAFSLELGYWKHPPLPSWIMHALLEVFGPSVMLPAVATQVSIVTALALTWRLGCEFMPPTRALIAVILTSLVTYHNIGGDSFNHNTVLLPFDAATLLVFYLATRRGTWQLWTLTGLFAGLSMLVKYVALMPLAGMLLYFVLDRQLHRKGPLLGLLLACGVFAAVLLPHALWLNQTDYLPFRYARAVTEPLPGLWPTMLALLDFLFTQALRLLPFVAGLWFVMAMRRSDASPAATEAIAMPSADRLFLWTNALAPLALTSAFGLASQSALQGRWGSNAFMLVGLWAMALWRRTETQSMLRHTVQFAVAAQLLLCAGQTLSKTIIAEHLHIRTRANFPGAVLARNALETWKANTGLPLRLVVSDIWLGGNIIAHDGQPLAVLIDGRYFTSPWVKAQAVERCGALVLDDMTNDSAERGLPSPVLEAFMARADVRGTWVLPWSGPPGASGSSARGMVRWGIIRPTSSEGCVLQ